MARVKIEVEGFQCERCGHKWVPRGNDEEPSVCPKCKSPGWMTEKNYEYINLEINESFKISLEKAIKSKIFQEQIIQIGAI